MQSNFGHTTEIFLHMVTCDLVVDINMMFSINVTYMLALYGLKESFNFNDVFLIQSD